jgi:MoxR-like ATPase
MKELSLLPLSKLNAALSHIGQSPVLGKSEAIIKLTSAINSGLIDLAKVQSATPVPIVNLASSTSEGLEQNMLTLKSEVKLALELMVRKIETEGAATVKQVEIFGAELRDAIETSSPAVDPETISQLVRDQVAAMLEPFKRSATPEVLAELADAAPVTAKAKIKDLFNDQQLTYSVDGESVDFSHLEVTVWNDPAAPVVVDDYIFNPRFLHESLLAIDRQLPMNCWLAGERGTGKTEFVTQIAARLKRRLFRINFDEAIERADFIGGNTIEKGDVVWKAGVLSQAIQHHGAIVLFDEIGFARSQSIAVLHSVCEPSVHRGVTINETGKRIPVLPYVAFFCADNSNGFGDNSGNFTGVRDQNTAFIDRFSYTFNFEYLPAKHEASLISKRTGLSKDASAQIVQFANVAREKSKSGLLTQPPSLRQLLAWATAVKSGIPVTAAYQSAVINKYPADCEAELKGIFTAVINVPKFKLSVGA